MGLTVHEADVPDRDGAKGLFTKEFAAAHPSVKIGWADRGYSGALVDFVGQETGIELEIVRRPRVGDPSPPPASGHSEPTEPPSAAPLPSMQIAPPPPTRPATTSSTDAHSEPQSPPDSPGPTLPAPPVTPPESTPAGPEPDHSSSSTGGFILVRKRWIVERTFGWFGRSRRLSRD